MFDGLPSQIEEGRTGSNRLPGKGSVSHSFLFGVRCHPDFGLGYNFAMKNLHDVRSVGEETERHAQGVPRHGITARPDLIIL